MKKLSYLFALLFFLCTQIFAAENVFYVLHSPDDSKELTKTLATIKNHNPAIQILISQAYQINSKGEVSGYLNQALVNYAKSHSIKLMAMITNAGFDQAKAHQFLSSDDAQQKALDDILAACKQYHLYGVQFDFEMISVKDKTLLTQFFKLAANRLHREGFAVSFAVIPAFSDKKDSSLFLRKSYENWSGAYDLKALGASSDFITIMAYNQHAEGTMPGPGASIAWVETAIKDTLKYIPANKISLGVPAYSLYWFTGTASSSSKRVTTQRREIGYHYAKELIDKNHSQIIWNRQDKVNYSIYTRNWLNEYVYLEDANSFKAKLALANKYHLRGVSVFRIGTEDEKIWALLHKKVNTRLASRK